MGKASQGLRTATGTPTTAQLSGIPTHCGGVRRRSVEEDCELPASATSYRELLGEIKAYLHAHARKHGHVRTAEAFGVSRHTLWRFLERGQPGRALPRAVMAQAGKPPRRSRRRRAYSTVRRVRHLGTGPTRSCRAACGRRCWRSARRPSPASTSSRVSDGFPSPTCAGGWRSSASGASPMPARTA